MATKRGADDGVAPARGFDTRAVASDRCRVGYLVPEFPGQTHLFFWRELQGLAEAGVDCELIATRRPPEGVVSQSWAKEAIKRTTYLAPPAVGDFLGLLGMPFKAGPVRLIKCLSVIAGRSDLTVKGRFRLFMLMLPATKLARLMRDKGLRHVHVQSCADAANIAMLASLISGITYSLSLLGPTLEGYGRNQANKWRHASFAVVMSDLLYKVVLERLAGALPPVVAVLPVGVDLEVMRRRGKYQPWRGGKVCKIYSCGRLNKIKGHRDLMDAVSIVRSRGIPLELSIAGEDELGGNGYRRELERHIAEIHAESFVKLLGAVGEDQHRACLEDAHIFALSSLNEGISVAIMEAMAMQVPVVVTNVGGNAELVEDGVSGVFTKPQDPSAFAGALETVLLDPEFALRLSERSRRKVGEKFDSHATAAKLAEHLFAVTSKSRNVGSVGARSRTNSERRG
jgi:colanic acid/amylovoran biosynthesis glycosyltransferase